MTQISKLLEKIGRTVLLTKEEEEELAEQVHSGDKAKAKAAKDKMVLSNIGLVVKIAHSFQSKGVPFEDLVSEGIVGLIKAVGHYRPVKGAKLSTYSAFWIKESMKRYVISARGVIRLPKKIPLSKYHYERMHQEGKSDEEIRKALGHGKSVFKELKTRIRIYSIDEKLDDREALVERIPDEKPGQDQGEIDLSAMVMNSRELSDMEKVVVVYRYGLNGGGEISLVHIAEILGRSKERIRQVEMNAIWKLRREFA